MAISSGYSDALGAVRRSLTSTVSPSQYQRFSQDVLAHIACEVVTSSETVSVATVSTITSSGSSARVGDLIRMTSGALSGAIFTVIEVTGTTYSLGQQFSTVPSAATTFEILRFRPLIVDSSGNLAATIDTSLLATAANQTNKSQFTKITDGTDTVEVEQAGTWGTSIPQANFGLTGNARAHQIWDANHPDNVSVGADGNFYAQNMDANGNLCTNLSSLRGTLIPAHGSADGTSVGMKLVGRAASSAPTAVSAAQRVNAYFDTQGRLCTFSDQTQTIGTVSTNNSSTTPLSGGAAFTGTGDDVLNVASIIVTVFADQNSATDGISLQWSPDNSNWSHIEPFTYTNGSPRQFILAPRARYFRVVYTNGGSAQGAFRLQTIFKTAQADDKQSRVTTPLTDDSAAQLVRSVITGVTTGGGGGYVNVKVSPSGAVQVGGSVDIGSALPAGGNTIGGVNIISQNHGKTILSTGGLASSSGNNTLVAAGTNRLKVCAFSLSTDSSTAVTAIFQSGASGTELWRVRLQAPASVSTGANLAVPAPAWLFATASATLLNLNLSAAVNIYWSVSYFDEA